MNFYTVNIEATVEGKSKVGARNSLIWQVSGLEGVSSVGMIDQEVFKKNTMNIYSIKRIQPCDYDEYDGYVIVAKNVKNAIKLMTETYNEKWEIKKIGTSTRKKEQLILSSFNAG